MPEIRRDDNGKLPNVLSKVEVIPVPSTDNPAVLLRFDATRTTVMVQPAQAQALGILLITAAHDALRAAGDGTGPEGRDGPRTAETGETRASSQGFFVPSQGLKTMIDGVIGVRVRSEEEVGPDL